ncbi:MAG: putative prolyl aminopeptidase [Solirubrobacterales bacterium]|nr:putative prolyl aminopeptidase [Solirubrobacterales bacterium]
MPALSQSVDLGHGRQAAYEVIGEGTPLIYFQGGPGFSAALLRPEAQLLADRFAVYLIDPAGSGGSTPPGDPSQYDHIGHARFYEEVRLALGIGPATIMGTSFGGIVALSYASLYPQVTRCCIAVASRAVGEEIEDDDAADEMEAFLSRHSHQPWYHTARKTWEEWTERVLAAESSHEVDAMMAEVLPLYTADPERPGVQAMIADWRRDMKSDLDAIKVWESGLWQRIDVRPLLAKIECPTLVLVGALDLLCGPAQGRLIAAGVQGAELVIVPGCGHFIAAEAPDAFRREIVEFAGSTQPR